MINSSSYYFLKAYQNILKIGLLVPIGRTDKYGYQYEELTKLIITNYLEFTDKILVISSSRFAERELFEVNPKIKFITNEDTWFQLENSNEIFSFQKLIDSVNLVSISFVISN